MEVFLGVFPDAETKCWQLAVNPAGAGSVAGIAAGTLRYPVWRFLLFCWLGKTIKTTVVAWAGSQSITLIEKFLN